MPDTEFAAVVCAQRECYPLMQPQDFGKLAYQSEYGPGHLISSSEEALNRLNAELRTLPKDPAPREPEPIGNGLCRFPLKAAEEHPALLARLFFRAAEEHHGTTKGMAERLDVLEALKLPGLQAWLAEYRGAGCPALHHSERFRSAYRPAYRLVDLTDGLCFSVLAQIETLMRQGRPVILSVDGRCGSGKTHLARRIAELFDGRVFHMDDFYLPVVQRPQNWEQQPAGNMDLERFRREVLTPAEAGREVRYRPFLCQTQKMGDPVTVPYRALTVVEGSYSQHPVLAEHYGLNLFLTCSKEEQTRRLRAREGAHFADFEARWIPLEERYFRLCRNQPPREWNVDTTNFIRDHSKT